MERRIHFLTLNTTTRRGGQAGTVLINRTGKQACPWNPKVTPATHRVDSHNNWINFWGAVMVMEWKNRWSYA